MGEVEEKVEIGVEGCKLALMLGLVDVDNLGDMLWEIKGDVQRVGEGELGGCMLRILLGLLDHNKLGHTRGKVEVDALGEIEGNN